MIRTRARRLACLVAAAALVLPACSDNSAQLGEFTVATTSTPPPTEPTAAAADPDGTAAVIDPSLFNDPDAFNLTERETDAAARDLWNAFFTIPGPVSAEGKRALLDGADTYGHLLDSFDGVDALDGLRPEIDSVELLTRTQCEPYVGTVSSCARVEYRLFVGNEPFSGRFFHYAIYRDGNWLLSSNSFCEVMSAFGQRCPTPPAATDGQ